MSQGSLTRSLRHGPAVRQRTCGPPLTLEPPRALGRELGAGGGLPQRAARRAFGAAPPRSKSRKFTRSESLRFQGIATTGYHDLGSDYHTNRLNKETKARSHIRQLQALGYTVTLTQAA